MFLGIVLSIQWKSAGFVASPGLGRHGRQRLRAEAEGSTPDKDAAKQAVATKLAFAEAGAAAAPAAATTAAAAPGKNSTAEAPEGGKRLRQFLALEPLEDEVNQWEADMKAPLTPDEENKKLVAIATGGTTFFLTGLYLVVNYYLENNDWSGFMGERTLSAEDLAMLQRS